MIDVLQRFGDYLLEYQKPSISVIMPVYNGERYLRDTLDSILNQTFSDFELITIDDGSSDSSLLILNEYAKSDDRIVIFTNTENKGIAYSTNFGIEQSKGKFIALTDQDDISLPERFELQIEFLNLHSDIDIVGSQLLSIESDRNFQWKSSYPLSPGSIRWGLLFGCIVSNSTVLMRRKIFDESGFRYGPPITAQDYEFFVKISPYYKIANIQNILVHFIRHDASTSRKKFHLQQQEAYEIIRAQVIDLIGENLPDEIISGIMQAKHQKKQREIGTIKIAMELSRVLTRLMHHALTWDLTDEDRFYIKQNTASRLRRIWQDMSYHPFLWPYVLYSVYLDPDVIYRKLRSLLTL